MRFWTDEINEDNYDCCMFSSKNLWSTSNVCQTIADHQKNVPKKVDSAILEAWLACRLIPLDENPRLRPPDVSEILRWIAGKVVVAATCNDVITNIGFLQWSISLCNALTLQRGKKRRSVISWCWKCDNAVNRKAFLHSVNIICSSIPSFVHNWYSKPSHLFVNGVVEILEHQKVRCKAIQLLLRYMLK